MELIDILEHRYFLITVCALLILFLVFMFNAIFSGRTAIKHDQAGMKTMKHDK